MIGLCLISPTILAFLALSSEASSVQQKHQQRRKKQLRTRHLQDDSSSTPLLTKEQIMQFQEDFRVLDINGDDYITVDELGLVMRSGIDLTDFLTLKRKVQGRITMLFNTLDQDDNGYISDDDLRLIINTVKHEHTPKEVEAMVRKADKNGDGKISSYELINVFFVPRDTPSYTYNPPPRPKYHSPPKYTSSVSLGADYSTLQDQQVEPSVIVVGVTAP